jgi:N-acetylmuramoyl-L-alanine amidase
MSAEKRLKRRLFREIADENLEIIQNRPRGSLRRQRAAREKRLQRLRRAVFAGGGTMVVMATMVLMLGMRTDATSGANSDVSDAYFLVPNMEPPASSDMESNLGALTRMLTGKQARAIDPAVIPLAVRKVVIDPGHGGIDSGTKLDDWGMYESNLTWDIAMRLRMMLARAGIEVVLTRHGDEKVSLEARTEIANRSKADLFVSIHINWLPNREARGFETYFAGATVDPFLKQLAAAENRDSGFSLADSRRLLDGIYMGVRQQESKRLAEWVGQALYGTLQKKQPEVIHRGVRQAPFVVLVATEMPAILAEVACLSNDREARLLALPQYRQSIAEALFTGIQGYALELSASEKGEKT